MTIRETLDELEALESRIAGRLDARQRSTALYVAVSAVVSAVLASLGTWQALSPAIDAQKAEYQRMLERLGSATGEIAAAVENSILDDRDLIGTTLKAVSESAISDSLDSMRAAQEASRHAAQARLDAETAREEAAKAASFLRELGPEFRADLVRFLGVAAEAYERVKDNPSVGPVLEALAKSTESLRVGTLQCSKLEVRAEDTVIASISKAGNGGGSIVLHGANDTELASISMADSGGGVVRIRDASNTELIRMREYLGGGALEFFDSTGRVLFMGKSVPYPPGAVLLYKNAGDKKPVKVLSKDGVQEP